MRSEKPYVLMLEDDADDRLITQLFFEENNYNIGLEFLTNSNDFMPWLADCSQEKRALPRLILLDRNVPSCGGMSVLKDIKSHPVFKTIPVIMISGTAFPGDVEESYRLGVNSFIIKPFSHEPTMKTIGSFLEYWFKTVELPVVEAPEYALL